MTPLTLGIVVSLAAGTVVGLAASGAITIAWILGRERIDRLAPAPRAHLLALLRLLPAASAILSVALTFNAFMRLEPAGGSETAGIVLVALALAALMAGVSGAVRVYAAWRQTKQTVREWPHEMLGRGRLPLSLIETSFPVVAVVGWWKPRLYIARQVMQSCDSRELDAMLAHEAAHVRAADNVMRLLFLSAPVARFRSKAIGAIERGWAAAAEERADDCARSDAESSLALASALTKVARLAANTRPPVLHASSIFSGCAVEARVRRLFAPRPESTGSALWPCVFAVAGVAIAGALSPTGLRTVYELAEFAVRQLP